MTTALAAVRQLVDDFKAQESYYLSTDYQESQARQDFIDKFFTALGWDVTHQRQKNPYEQEVKIENKVNAQGSQRRADYAFFIAPNFRDVKFFAEAKKPYHDLASSEYYHQAIRYAWNKKTPIAVLTDFEEFHIIDCRYTPNMNTALDRKIEVFHYSDYADEEKFKRIFYLFGRDAVAAGSIEKFAADLPKPRGKAKGLFKGGYQPVDEAFLEALDGHRDTLARSFKSNNPDLNGEELTEAVQRTLDRLVFMRFLEDKQIEDPAVVEFRSKPSAWKAFISYSKSLEPKYNGLIFKPHRIIDADDFTPPDDEQFADICNELADPTSPYDFDKIPIWILGSIYERFLGKVVRATDKRAKVEEKPEVRKAGGVYYTPEYIVRYIVKETVGKLIDGKTPAQIADMAFADIACGSGSFLLEVYSTLIEYHTRWYNDNPEKAKKADVETRDGLPGRQAGKLVLSLKKLQEILTNNIYGVDIDFQATEVTQLSLYLRLLEDVTLTQLHLFKEKVLPDLRRNIVCGNSLIEPDIEAQTSLFASDAPSPSEGNTPSPRKGHSEPRGGTGRGPEPAPLDHLKPMRFTDAFPNVMKRGGFDAIVGNPPYVRQELLTDLKDYFKLRYRTYHGVADLYVYFIEKGMSLLHSSGELCFIVASKWMKAKYGQSLRGWLQEKQVEEVVDFGDIPVFDGATTYTCILRVRNGTLEDSHIKVINVEGSGLSDFGTYVGEHSYVIDRSSLHNDSWSLANQDSRGLFEKIRNSGTILKEFVGGNLFYGIKTGFNDAFVIDREIRARLIKEHRSSEELIKPFLVGKDIKRYERPQSFSYVIFTRRGIDIRKYPAIERYLLQFKQKLIPKPTTFKGDDWEGRKGGDYKWFEIQDTVDYFQEFKKPKIMWPGISSEVTAFALDESGYYGNDNTQLIISKNLYLLGIINSSVSRFVLKTLCDKVQGGFFRLKIAYVEQLPIRAINFSDPADKSRHDHIVSLVEQMLAAKEKLAAAKSDADVNRLEMQCEGLDRQIDDAVYELYGLTKEEIEIVEKE